MFNSNNEHSGSNNNLDSNTQMEIQSTQAASKKIPCPSGCVTKKYWDAEKRVLIRLRVPVKVRKLVTSPKRA